MCMFPNAFIHKFLLGIFRYWEFFDDMTTQCTQYLYFRPYICVFFPSVLVRKHYLRRLSIEIGLGNERISQN